MGNLFNVKHGAPIRYSAAVSTTDATTIAASWKKGRLFSIDGSGNAIIHNGLKTSPIVGMGLETRALSTTVGPYTTVTVVGAPSGEKTSMILDEAVVINDELQSGVAFTAGAALYCSTTGFVTVSGNGTGPNAVLIGAALSPANAGDTARPLTMFFSVTY